MAMTAAVKDELSRVVVTKVSARKAEVSTVLRFAGGLHIVGGRVIVEAEHLCMSLRGVQKPGALTVTSALRGIVRDDPRTREEFLSLVSGSR